MKRAALFVGVNNYQAPLRPLSCAREDAAALYQFFLKDYSPDLVHFLPDPDSDAIIDKVKFITANLDSGDLFLIYFSGHGVEARNEHLLLSARAENLAGEWRHAVSINLLKELTKKSGVQTVFIIDSCRDGYLKLFVYLDVALTVAVFTGGLYDLTRAATSGASTLSLHISEHSLLLHGYTA